MHTRKIPSTGEPLPVVGCGTWQTFDVGAGAGRARAARRGAEGAVRGRRLGDRQLADVRPAEGVVGDLLAAAGTRDKAFLATKVWTQGRDAGIAQMKKSMRAAAHRPHRPDADPQPGRLAHPPADAEAPGRPRAASADSASRTTRESPHAELEAVLRAERLRLRADQLRARRSRASSAACCRSPPNAASR